MQKYYKDFHVSCNLRNYGRYITHAFYTQHPPIFHPVTPWIWQLSVQHQSVFQALMISLYMLVHTCLTGQSHLPVCPLSNFRSHRFVQNPFGYYTNLLFYLISYLTLHKMLVLTCLFPKIHTPSSIGIVYIYFIIALVFIMICIVHVIYCQAIAAVANVTCWL